MYKRPARIEPIIEHNSMDYAERGERCDDCNYHLKKGNDTHFRISKSLIVNLFMYAVIFMVFFAGFTEISSNRQKRSIEDSISRRLLEKRPELQKCDRSVSLNASQHVMCYANQARVLIVSDMEQHREMLDEGKYRDVPMYFMNIHDLYSSSHDVIDFLKTFDTQSPWVFVDGSFIGNRKDMDEYHDYEVLGTGVDKAPIPPHLNEDEVRFLHSSNLKDKMTEQDIQDLGINPARIRRHLREKLHRPSENKFQQYLKGHLDTLINHQKTVEHIDMIQKAQSGEYSAHYVPEKKD
jgi:glutaredoxin